MAAGIMTGVFLLLLVLPAALAIDSEFCPITYRAKAPPRAEHYTVSCGWWGRRCGRTRYFEAYQTLINKKNCCTGYRGTACNIPVCQPACANRGTCISPNVCECPTGQAGATCTLQVCSWLKDCYPGACSSNTCACSSEFSGPNCERMLDVPTFPVCKGHLIKKQEAMVTPLGEATCDSDVTYTSRNDLTHVTFDYEVSYPRLRDLPPLPSGGYLRTFRVGVIETHALAKVKDADGMVLDTKQANCVTSPATSRNPQETIICSIDHPITSRLLHGYRLELQMFGTTGGFKEILKGGTSSGYDTRQITGSEASTTATFKFDLEPPHHCFATRTCADDSGSPVETGRDVTQNSTTQIGFFGWEDSDSNLGMVTFELYSMAINAQGQLDMTGAPVSSGRWEFSSQASMIDITIPSPGLFSIVARVMDHVNNSAYARGLLLYDPSSEVTVTDQPVRVQGVPMTHGAFWVNTIQSAGDNRHTLTVSWSGRYSNSFYKENRLLAAVKPYDQGLDDNQGNRTHAAVANVDGVVGFEYWVEDILPPGTVGRRRRRATPTWTSITPVADHMDLSLPRSNGERFVLHLKALDLAGHVKLEEFPVRVDTTPPNIVPGSASFHPNTGYRDSKIYSRIDVSTTDFEGGVASIQLRLFDVSNGRRLIANLEQEAQTVPHTYCAPGDDCFCTGFAECFPTDQTVHLRNCVLKNHINREVELQVDVLNQADHSSRVAIQLGLLRNLTGIGWYPSPTGVKVAKDYGYGVLITWAVPESCYDIASLKLLLSGSTEKTIAISGSNTTSVDVPDLLPLHGYVARIRTYYQGGQVSDAAQISFTTGGGPPNTGTGGNVAIIVGSVVGGIVFLVLVLIVAVVLIRLKTSKPLPRHLDRAARSVINRFSRMPHDTTELDIHRTVPNAYASDNPAMMGNTAYVSRPRFQADEDDIYAYGELQTDPSAAWKHSEDTVFFGKTMVVGRFAEIKMATLVSDGVKTNVVAKLLPAGSSEEDVLLMKAKMNFMAEGLDQHRNLVNFEGAVTEGALAPMILLEHCDMGLRDWLKSHNSTTSDLEDELVDFCLGIARAVEFLHSHEILHRRLGTRNVLLKAVGDTLIPKVIGFGPMKGEQEGQSAQETQKSHVPVKWMAPEQIGLRAGETRPYTKMTDAWSYGITVWEIYSNGAVPYGEKKNKDVITFVKEGNRLRRPPVCSELMFNDVVMACWVASPDDRMTIADVRSSLENLFFNSGQGDYYGSDMYKPGGTGQDQDENVYSNSDYYSVRGGAGN